MTGGFQVGPFSLAFQQVRSPFPTRIIYDDAEPRKKQFKRVRHDKEQKRQIISELVAQAMGLVESPIPEPMAQEVREIVAGKVDAYQNTVDIDWAKLEQKISRLYRIALEYDAAMRELDDEEAFLLL